MKADRADAFGKDSRRDSPRERKELDYARHRRGFSEHHHSLRHGKWRKKRRAALKPERQGAAQLLRSVVGIARCLDDTDLVLPVRRRLSKWGAARLGDWVRRQHERRAEGFGWNMLKVPYDAAIHRVPFAAALRSVTESSSSAIPVAERFELLLRMVDAAEPLHDPRWYRNRRQVEWLRAFFRDEPASEQRLRAWLRAV